MTNTQIRAKFILDILRSVVQPENWRGYEEFLQKVVGGAEVKFKGGMDVQNDLDLSMFPDDYEIVKEKTKVEIAGSMYEIDIEKAEFDGYLKKVA